MIGRMSTQGMTREEEIKSHRDAAQSLLSQIQSDPIIGNTNNNNPTNNSNNNNQSHMGLPNNLPQLADLLIEASLLPKPWPDPPKGKESQHTYQIRSISRTIVNNRRIIILNISQAF